MPLCPYQSTFVKNIWDLNVRTVDRTNVEVIKKLSGTVPSVSYIRPPESTGLSVPGALDKIMRGQ